jgi:hypothetical protein
MTKNKKLRYKSKAELDSQKTVQLQTVADVGPKIPLPAWFEKKVKQGELRSWQEAALEVFMRKQGLGVLEPEDRYEEMFKKF